MMSWFKIRRITSLSNGRRNYAMCNCPPYPPPCGCPVPGAGRRIVPPADCRPGPVPPNPCVPKFPGKNVWKKYRNIVYFICFPLILLQGIATFGQAPPPKGECREYEYMRRRTKRFPWGKTGMKSLFHNKHTNHLPGECVPPPLDCD